VLCALQALAGGGSIRKVSKPVKDEYIVRLVDSLSASQVRQLAQGLSQQHGAKLGDVYETVVPAFVATMTEGAARGIAHHPLVQFVEEVAVSEIAQAQTAPPWHLDRIDQRYLPLDNSFAYGCGSGEVYAYVLDTGVKASHVEFWAAGTTTSRVVDGYSAIGLTKADAMNPSTSSCGYGTIAKYCLNAGHGTAVASIIGGRTYGVKKDTKIISVQTHTPSSGSSQTAYIIRGLQWIYNDKPTRLLSTGAIGAPAPAVANMSWTVDVGNVYCPTTDPSYPNCLSTMEQWINKLIDERNITVVAAGHNRNTNATLYSPARMARGNGGKVITVGGSTNTDRRWVCNPANAFENPTVDNTATACGADAAGSNYGIAIDIFAPAQNISSATIRETYQNPYDPTDPEPVCCRNSDTAERQFVRSGTSFATPAVAGAAARALQGSGYTRTPLQVWQDILANSTVPAGSPSVMQEAVPGTDPNSGPLNGSPNRLLHVPGYSRCRAL
jgi:hypothetical protein